MGKCERCNDGWIPDLLGGMSGGYRCDSCDGHGNMPDDGLENTAAATSETSEMGRDTYLVHVDPNRTLAQAIAAGGYDWVNEDITAANFPDPPMRTGDVRVELIHFDRRIRTAGAESGIADRGRSPADLWVALALAERFPDLQRKFPLVALGSVWAYPYGYRYVPCLCGLSGHRDLGLSWARPSDEWLEYYRFLAVRK
jgi:hypothetical protein